MWLVRRAQQQTEQERSSAEKIPVHSLISPSIEPQHQPNDAISPVSGKEFKCRLDVSRRKCIWWAKPTLMTLPTMSTLGSLRSLVAFRSGRSLSTSVTFKPLGALRPGRTRRPLEAGSSTSSRRPGRTLFSWEATLDVSWALNKETAICSHIPLQFFRADRLIGVWCYVTFVATVNASMGQ